MANILIADDEKSIRKTLREILEYESYKVDEAADGAQAFEMLKDGDYACALLDIKMPKMDGLEVLTKLQGTDCETPIIMISGHGTVENAVEATKKGAFDFINKPPDLNRLLITVRNAMDKISLVTETKILKKDEVYSFCMTENYDYSSFLRMIKGQFKSYKNWVM